LILHHEYFYKYHKEHHSKVNPKFIDTYKGHILEGPFQGLGVGFSFTIFKYYLIEKIIIIILLNLRGMLRHDERGIFLVGNHHLLHHRYPKYNYGEYWIDYICGTKYSNEYGPFDNIIKKIEISNL